MKAETQAIIWANAFAITLNNPNAVKDQPERMADIVLQSALNKFNSLQ